MAKTMAEQTMKLQKIHAPNFKVNLFKPAKYIFFILFICCVKKLICTKSIQLKLSIHFYNLYFPFSFDVNLYYNFL